jgi:hypothetical protein
MEFVPLRNLQRGLPEVWQTLNQENGRVVLTNKGKPAYLLVDLSGQNVISLINWLDYYRSNPEDMPKGQSLTQEQRQAAQKFLTVVRSLRKDGLDTEDEKSIAALESGKYKTNLSRELDL